MEKEFVMFKHILIPTDGSEQSNRAIANGVTFAKEISAKITGLTVTEPFHYFATESLQVADTADQYNADVKILAARNLSVLKDAADKAGVDCVVLHSSSEHPYQEIVKTAQERGCDVIFQASHGRHGLGALIMGSETQKVLTHTKIPVLVYR
jgi:nucleotide-binding universal stress UspA family protein